MTPEEKKRLQSMLGLRNKLIKLRLEHCASVRDLARAAGIREKTLWEIEHGLRIPRLNLLVKLFKVMGYELGIKEDSNG